MGDEARRYYIGIVGKYGAQVQALLKKAAALDIAIICPLHGPVLNENLGYYLDKYNTWSSYGSRTRGVVIAHTSVYGHERKLWRGALPKSRIKWSKQTSPVAIWRWRPLPMRSLQSSFVLATTTYNRRFSPAYAELSTIYRLH